MLHLSNGEEDVVLGFSKSTFFLEKKRKEKSLLTSSGNGTRLYFDFFISFKVDLVELSRVGLGTFSNFLVCFYRNILSFQKQQSETKN
jgi:hypothetical protein